MKLVGTKQQLASMWRAHANDARTAAASATTKGAAGEHNARALALDACASDLERLDDTAPHAPPVAPPAPVDDAERRARADAELERAETRRAKQRTYYAAYRARRKLETANDGGEQ